MAGTPDIDSAALIAQLSERAKELTCLYQVEELLTDYDRDFALVLQDVVDRLPPGWEFPALCSGRLVLHGNSFVTAEFALSSSMLTEEITGAEGKIGFIEVSYRPGSSGTTRSFLPEEKNLLRTIAQRIGEAAEHRELRRMVREVDQNGAQQNRWQTVVELLLRTDQRLYSRIARKLLTHIRRHDVDSYAFGLPETGSYDSTLELSARIFSAAEKSLPESTIYSLLQRWVQEDKGNFIFRVLVNLDHSLADAAEAIRRFIDLNPPDGLDVSAATARGVRVLLIRRMITNQIEYIRAAERHLTVRDFYDLLERIIIPPHSHGVLGGKAAGVILAGRIIRDAGLDSRAADSDDRSLSTVKIPRTWYLPTDGLHYFMNYNDMEDLFEQVYKPIEDIRNEYPHIVGLFKASRFPPDIVHGLATALDDLGSEPIIVRSSSRLEDRYGAAFSGKYRSVFLGNEGTKEQRLQALLHAVAEVYASMFAPDPVQYRAERGLLDVREEMGVIIQQVVGRRYGPFFLPLVSGLAFSSNEFRWSPGIERDDGLLRLVPGLGTRAVDRISEDYPVLAAPGRPELHVNSRPEERVAYSPRYMDVLRVAGSVVETIPVEHFLTRYGASAYGIEQVISRFSGGEIRNTAPSEYTSMPNELVVTCDGLFANPTFISTVRRMLRVLEKEFGSPVDIELAWDGERVWLLQCRPQSRSDRSEPVPIPKNVRSADIIFSAKRFISNGFVPDITHIVYVDPKKYATATKTGQTSRVARAVGELNRLLPKRAFILVGPGRWGSRGPGAVGVQVGYADINNTAVLLEVALGGEGYAPDLSFGTHFFQDLVESAIRYIPLYPTDEGVVFNERFLLKSRNVLEDLLPEYADLSEIVHVIDVPGTAAGKILRILLNADLGEGLAILAEPEGIDEKRIPGSSAGYATIAGGSEHWRWRYDMAERIAAEIDGTRFGVKSLYILGSVKNGTAGPGSDIDLIVHVEDDPERIREFKAWIEGWSLALSQMNFLRTGYRSGGMLDVHYLTDADVAQRNSYAVKIDAVTDPAEKLQLAKPAATVPDA